MSRPDELDIHELCTAAGCPAAETQVLALLADGHSVDSAAAELLISPSKAWGLRRSAKRRIRSYYGLDPDDAEYEDDVERRKAQIIRMHFRGYGAPAIADRLGLHHKSVQEAIRLWYANNKDLESPHLRVGSERYDDWPQPSREDYPGRDSFLHSSGKSRKSREAQTHWASSTGIDPFLPPGAPGGPPEYPVTTRRIGDDG